MREGVEFAKPCRMRKQYCASAGFQRGCFKSPVLQKQQKRSRDFILLACIFKHLKNVLCASLDSMK